MSQCQRGWVDWISVGLDDQTTTYTYGTTLAEGGIASRSLLRRVSYPDSAGPADAVTYAYNRLGERVEMRDQNGTVHAYDLDGRGRLRADRVTALGSGVDGGVRRLETAYDEAGRCGFPATASRAGAAC